MSVRVVFANRSGFDAPIGVVMAWEEHGSRLNIFRTRNHDMFSETSTNYEAKFLLRNGFDAGIGVVLAWEERGSCLNIFWSTNRDRISENFTNYEAKHLLRNHHGIGGAWTCLNIFWMIIRGRISETFMNYEAKDLLRKCVKHVDVKSRSDLINFHELRGKRLVAQVSETCRFALYLRTGVVLMLQLESSWLGRSVDLFITYSGREIASGFDAGNGVVMESEERGHVLTYSGRQIMVGSQKP
ncbi:uncharacterized protein G2W53_026457 [Senna tora]|uniref:Uncharacterized protein n=1 Tax=Senna tora TaxID=362788 RepID=A0A834WFP3_9FABA|nr:uncharacterized protein G2W53_026457 [Senna tora]